MVTINLIERVTLNYGEDDDVIKMYETLYDWYRVTKSRTHVTFECKRSACFTSDDYRKTIMDVEYNGSENE